MLIPACYRTSTTKSSNDEGISPSTASMWTQQKVPGLQCYHVCAR
jgi:hypothetical protein